MSEQAELRILALWRREMLGCQLRPRLVEAKLLASGFETPPDHPGNRSGTSHAFAELGIVILAAAHVADQVKDMTVTVWKFRHQPLAKQVTHLDRQPQQDVTCTLHAHGRRRIEDAL